MPISTVWMLKYAQQCFVKWLWTVSSLGAPETSHKPCQSLQWNVCAAHVNNFFPVIWSSVLISVTREWRYCGLVCKFFLINNIDLKCSFVQCRKYHKSWSNGAAELHISVDLLCGTTVAELHNSVDLLCDTLAAELHNSVNLPCGTIDCLQSAFLFELT